MWDFASLIFSRSTELRAQRRTTGITPGTGWPSTPCVTFFSYATLVRDRTKFPRSRSDTKSLLLRENRLGDHAMHALADIHHLGDAAIANDRSE